MSDFINTIDVLGDDVVISSIIDKTIADFSDNVIDCVGNLAFSSCNKLTKVNLPNVKTLESFSFLRCTSLVTLILSSETVCKLNKVDAFNNTPIASGPGYIYVPSALVDSYKSETNWSAFANQFRALEDYTVDGTITGELDETKI